MQDTFEIVVVGAGHAGCEAALACARMGHKTLLTTLNLDSLAMMPCNPSIGGTAKGHLVRELDALGGEMAKAADRACIQYRLLNRGKGPAVWSLRAQADRRRYQQIMKHTLEQQENLTLRQKFGLVAKEMRIGSVNGLLLGVAAFGLLGLYICLVMGRTPLTAFAVSGCIGLSLLVAMVISSAIGTLIPLFFKKINVDPAVASGPLITTVNDLVAVVTYYGLSWLLLLNLLHLAG